MAADPYYNNTLLLLHGDNAGDPNGNSLAMGFSGAKTVADVGTLWLGGSSNVVTIAGRQCIDLSAAADSARFVGAYGTPTAVFDGDFTLEWWFYQIGDVTYNTYGGSMVGATSSPSACSLYYNSTNGDHSLSIRGGGVSFYYTPPKNQWNHHAIVVSSGVASYYVNGVRRGSGAVGSSSYAPANGFRFGYTPSLSNSGIPGYLSGARLYKGVAKYSGPSFTVPAWPDLPYSSAVDSSPVNRRMNVQGSTANPYTTEYKFGGGCFRFDGASYLAAFTATDLDLGGGDWTIEFWAKANSLANGGLLHRGYYDSATTNWTGLAFSIRKLSGATVRFYFYGVSAATEQYIDVANCLPVGSWVHVAMVRRANTGYIYVDGVLSGTRASLSTPAASTQSLRIGLWDYSAANEYFDGFMDDIRITKGIARYTTDFTPPAAAFGDGQTVISGTVRDIDGVLCQRRVNVHSRATGRLLGTADSDPVTGVFSIGAAEDCYAVVLDSTGAYNALVLDRLTPG